MTGSTQLIESVDELRQQIEFLREQLDENKDLYNENPLERPFTLINLPSKGLYYPGGKSSLMVRYLTSYEENVLIDEFLMESGKGMEFVLNSIIVDDDFDIKNILPGDAQALSLFLRSTSYGDKIEPEMECPKCHKTAPTEYHLSSFQMKDDINIPDENGELTYFLPKGKVEVAFRQLTYWEQKKVKNKKHLEKMLHQITRFGDVTDKREIFKLLHSMNVLDNRMLRKSIDNQSPGIHADFQYNCLACGETSNHSFKGDYEFLMLPAVHKKNMLEEIFLLTYYGKGITRQDALKMPVTERKWHINRISEEVEKKNEAERKAYAKSKSGGR